MYERTFVMKKAIPLIFDTDIGSDIDDTWALAMALKSPEIDLKMVSVNGFGTDYQARLSAKILSVAGREDVIVAKGRSTDMDPRYQEEWIGDYSIEDYPNYKDNAAQAIVDYVMTSDEEVTILVAGASTNIADAYKIDPRIANKCKIVAIGGVIYNGHCGGWYPPLGSDWNVKCDVESWNEGLVKSDIPVELLPLDVTGNLYLDEGYYSRIKACAEKDPVIKALCENFEVWAKNIEWGGQGGTSALFDTVGVYACFTKENLEYQVLPIYANDAAQTLIDPERGKEMNVALRWGDKEKFRKFLTARLCGEI
ncbi:MAG: nucleoside hydrolase [Ruminococcaceae bacterium]|nr:nucleoside hydrolase [Oscillospiraceae bacterium]